MMQTDNAIRAGSSISVQVEAIKLEWGAITADHCANIGWISGGQLTVLWYHKITVDRLIPSRCT